MASGRVTYGGSQLTSGQSAQLDRDRAIKAERQQADLDNRLQVQELQNRGQLAATRLAGGLGLQKEQLSQQGATVRQGMGDTSAMEQTRLRESEQTGRQKMSDTSAMERLAATNKFTLEQQEQKNQFDTAGDHRKAAAAALVAGAPGAQLNQAMNTNPGFPVDFSGVQVPLTNSKVDQFQFVEQDNGPGQPKTVMAGNKQTGSISPAAAALSMGPRQQQDSQSAPADHGQTEPSGSQDAYAQVYQRNPSALQEDTDFATSQIGTAYRTDQEQLAYLNAMRKTNPMLFQAVKQRLGAQQR